MYSHAGLGVEALGGWLLFMRFKKLAVYSGAAALGLALACRDGSPPQIAATPHAPVAVGAASALKVHVDPKTGRFTAPPPATQAGARGPAPMDLNTSHEGLVEEPSPTPGGGFMVNLQGRFQSRAMVEVGTNGALMPRCETQGAAR